MTPLYHITQAAEHFKAGNKLYKFDVPEIGLQKAILPASVAISSGWATAGASRTTRGRAG